MWIRAIKPQNRFKKKIVGKILIFRREGGGGGGYPSMENSMKIINIFFEPFPKGRVQNKTNICVEKIYSGDLRSKDLFGKMFLKLNFTPK